MRADLVIDMDRRQTFRRKAQTAPQQVQQDNRVDAAAETDRNGCGLMQAAGFKSCSNPTDQRIRHAAQFASATMVMPPFSGFPLP